MTRECFSMRSSLCPTGGKDIRPTTMLARLFSPCGWSRWKQNSLRQQEQFVLICCHGIQSSSLSLRYLSFIEHAFNPEKGKFRNFLGYDRRWNESEGSEDCHGRAVWALGTVLGRSANPGCGLRRAVCSNSRCPRFSDFAVLEPAPMLCWEFRNILTLILATAMRSR